jgi:hypothetical protein
MPDAQVPLSPETRDYLSIAETSNRSPSKRFIIGLASADSDRMRVSVTKVVIHWPTFEAAVMRRGTNGVA